MKRTHVFGLLMLFWLSLGIVVTGCDDYDDSALRQEMEDIHGEISDIKSQLETLQGQINSVQALVDALNDGKVVTGIDARPDGKTYILTFNDGTRIEVVRGGNESQVSVIDVDGATYWAVVTNGEAELILNSQGNKVPFFYGADYLSVDAEGYWLLEGKRITDGNGDYVKLVNDGAIFTDIIVEEERIIFVLPDREVVIPRKTGTFLAFENAVSVPYTLQAGKATVLPVRISDDMQLVEIAAQPDGWTVGLDVQGKNVSITPSLGSDEEETYEVRLQGIDEEGLLYMAVARIHVSSMDFSASEGVFILNEGNMTSGNGSLIVWIVCDWLNLATCSSKTFAFVPLRELQSSIATGPVVAVSASLFPPALNIKSAENTRNNAISFFIFSSIAVYRMISSFDSTRHIIIGEVFLQTKEQYEHRHKDYKSSSHQQMPLRSSIAHFFHHYNTYRQCPFLNTACHYEYPEIIVPSPFDCHDYVCDKRRFYKMGHNLKS